MRLRDVSDVDNQVPYHGVVGAARFLRRHLVLTVADAVKQNTIRLAGHSLRIREVRNRQAHALGDISLAVAVVSMAHGTVDLIKILGLGLRFSGWLYRIAFGGRGGWSGADAGADAGAASGAVCCGLLPWDGVVVNANKITVENARSDFNITVLLETDVENRHPFELIELLAR